jgi:hypothetical protein
MIDNRVPPCCCLNCGFELDAAFDTSLVERSPRPGDATICIICGHLMVFGNDLTLRELTDEEIKKFAGDPRIVRAQQARYETHKELHMEQIKHEHDGSSKTKH